MSFWAERMVICRPTSLLCYFIAVYYQLYEVPNNFVSAIRRINCIYQCPIVLQIFGSGSDPISPLILLFLLGRPLYEKCIRLHRFKSDGDEIRQDCSLREYALIDGVGFRIRRHSYLHFAKSLHPAQCDVILARRMRYS